MLNIGWLLVAMSFPWLVDALVRLCLGLAGRRWQPPSAPAPGPFLVLVPSRAEGQRVEATLRSCVQAAHGFPVQTFLLLDGADPEAAAVAHQLGVSVLLKEPAGPRKADVLRFATQRLKKELAGVQAVLILDVGSQLPEDFFRSLCWPPGAAAVQTYLQAQGGGVGTAAGFSEQMAQQLQDRGREVLGWNVRLRGTGTFFTPQALRAIAPHLRTPIEDTEATLLLASQGLRCQLACPAAKVLDQKPTTTAAAARQRARWLAGQVALLRQQRRVWLRLLLASPGEAVAFACELLSRPLVLSTGARLLAGAALLALGFGQLHLFFLGWGAVAAASAAAEVVFWVHQAPEKAGAFLQMLLAWLRAATLFPLACFRWLFARKENS